MASIRPAQDKIKCLRGGWVFIVSPAVFHSVAGLAVLGRVE
jgi:hypothetical protein